MAVPTLKNHEEQGETRLPYQWRDKPVMQGLVKSLMSTVQEVEDTLFELLNETSIYVAVGNQLDVIGLIVGLERGGMDDATYRAELLKRISVNRSDGTTEVIISLMESATQTNDTNFWEHYPASIFYFIRGGYFNQLKEILEGISQAGVKAVLMFDEGDAFIPAEYLMKLEILVDEFLDAIEIADGSKGDVEYWVDPASTIGTGWADDGNGSYTHSGASGEIRAADGILVEDKLYVFSCTAVGAGSFSLRLGGTSTNGYNVLSGLTAGAHSHVIAAEGVAGLNLARIISANSITVHSISLREAVLDNLAVNVVATVDLPTEMSYLPEIQEVTTGIDLWTDPADTIQTGWTDNGSGSYTHAGASSELRSGAGDLVEDQLYSVEMTVSGAGSVTLIAGDTPTNGKNTIAGLTVGDHLFNIRAEDVDSINAFRIISSTSVTVAAINIKEAQVINPLCDLVEFTG